MARVTVFVDDAVLGRFPNLCAYDGAPADRRVAVNGQVGGMNPAWFLLVLLGPPGWLVLLLLSTTGSETLNALVPVCADTVERWRRLRLHRWAAAGAVALCVALLVFGPGGDPLRWYVTGAAVVALLVTNLRLTMGGIGVHLDASRRWVTLTGVDADFAAAVRSQQELHRR